MFANALLVAQILKHENLEIDVDLWTLTRRDEEVSHQDYGWGLHTVSLSNWQLMNEKNGQILLQK